MGFPKGNGGIWGMKFICGVPMVTAGRENIPGVIRKYGQQTNDESCS